MISSSDLIVSVGIAGAFWRAAFVAAVAVIAFVLVRYWQSLSTRPPRVRYLLVALRGVSMLLLAFAFAGLRLEYETQSQPRVLVYRSTVQRGNDEAKIRAEDDATKRLIASLTNNEFEVVEDVGIRGVTASKLDTSPPAASIYLTNGSIWREDSKREIERGNVAAGGGPVFVVTDFQASESPVVVLENVTVVNRTPLGVPFVVRCELHARSMKGRSTLVTISDDAQVRTSAQAQWTNDDERQALTLELVPKTAGWISYVARAEAAGGEDANALSLPFAIYAEERRQRVLFIEGEPTWEAKFIRRALDKAELFDVDYFAQVSRAAMVGAKDKRESVNAGDVESTEGAGKSAPLANLRSALSSSSRLNSYDCIIIGATPDAIFSNAEATRLREWVERRGGGMIILGSNSFSGSVVAPRGKLASLMPAEIDASGFRSDSQMLARNTPVDAGKAREGVLLTPTREGQAGALRAYSIAIEGKAGPGALNGEGFKLSQLRPGATMLAVTGPADESGTSEAGPVAIASMRYGAGRSIVFGPADSWRMRTSESGEDANSGSPFASLWQGLTLWAASTARPAVEIVLNDNSPETGNEVTAEIRVRDDAYVPVTIEKLNARVEQLSETAVEGSSTALLSREIAFLPDRTDPKIWRAHFPAPPIGRFNLRIKYVAGGKSGSVEKYFATVAPSTYEGGESRDALRRLARATGGEVYPASDINSLIQKLATLPRESLSVRRAWEVRTWWPLALIIPLLLSCEWLILRMTGKVNGVGGKHESVGRSSA